jgi:2-polyprenyl-3-methyl-5-hydroxy-6-metoxy-1,4-benzoquinol methylase
MNTTKLKTAFKNLPIIGPLALAIYRKFVPGPSIYAFERIEWQNNIPEHSNEQLAQIGNLLNYTKTSGSSYSAKRYPAGYHTLRIDQKEIKGQRDPEDRLSKLSIDFSGLRVLDIGCNQGGMLFSVAKDIKWGVGVDFDYRLINCCTKLSQLTQTKDTLSFYTFNIDKDPHKLLLDFFPEQTAKVDVIFLLAVCMWVDKWKELIDLCAQITDCLVFESNGLPDAQEAQINHLGQRFAQIDMVDYDKEGKRQLIRATH